MSTQKSKIKPADSSICSEETTHSKLLLFAAVYQIDRLGVCVDTLQQSTGKRLEVLVNGMDWVRGPFRWVNNWLNNCNLEDGTSNMSGSWTYGLNVGLPLNPYLRPHAGPQ